MSCWEALTNGYQMVAPALLSNQSMALPLVDSFLLVAWKTEWTNLESKKQKGGRHLVSIMETQTMVGPSYPTRF